MEVRALRREYLEAPFNLEDAHADPVEQFEAWFEQALRIQIRDPNAMTLSTADARGRPAGRIVLMKEFNHGGWVFYSHYRSRKGLELQENPWGALTFWWDELVRQVRIEGRVERTSRTSSESYFASRPHESRVSAAASPQSRPIPDRETLLRVADTVRRQYEGVDVPCPKDWGGYCLKPQTFEFWQGRPNRLHDRIAYRPGKQGTWIIERLAP